MIYERYFAKAEDNHWSIENDIPWKEFDQEEATRDTELLETLRQAALIESYAPMYALKGLTAWWNSVEESAIASIQFFEEYKHYFALKRYLALAGVEISDREIIELREPNFGTHYHDRVRQLANYMISEHFTAYFYERLAERSKEPVLQRLLQRLTLDELRHCSVFYSLLERRIAEDRKATVDAIIAEAFSFRHQAAEVLGVSVPISMKNDFAALLHFWNRVERLTGVDLRDVKRTALEVTS